MEGRVVYHPPKPLNHSEQLQMLTLFLHFYMPIMFEIFIPIISLLLWIIGVFLICYGAYWNDNQKGTFKKFHQIIRISLAVLLTLILLLI